MNADWAVSPAHWAAHFAALDRNGGLIDNDLALPYARLAPGALVLSPHFTPLIDSDRRETG